MYWKEENELVAAMNVLFDKYRVAALPVGVIKAPLDKHGAAALPVVLTALLVKYGIPCTAPWWVPIAFQRTTTLSSAAIMSSTVVLMSGKAAQVALMASFITADPTPGKGTPLS
jgi:hypothetical protein